MWIQVTFDYDHPHKPHDGAVHFRVYASPEEDWSGWAPSAQDAHSRAEARMADIRARLSREVMDSRLG